MLIARSEQRLVLLGKREAEETAQTSVKLTHGPLSIDADIRRVFVGDNEVFLTKLEFDLLHFLLQHPEHVMTRDKLLEHVWGFDYVGDEDSRCPRSQSAPQARRSRTQRRID